MELTGTFTYVYVICAPGQKIGMPINIVDRGTRLLDSTRAPGGQWQAASSAKMLNVKERKKISQTLNIALQLNDAREKQYI